MRIGVRSNDYMITVCTVGPRGIEVIPPYPSFQERQSVRLLGNMGCFVANELDTCFYLLALYSTLGVTRLGQNESSLPSTPRRFRCTRLGEGGCSEA